MVSDSVVVSIVVKKFKERMEVWHVSSGSWKADEHRLTRKGNGEGPTTMSIRLAALHSKHSSLSIVEYERLGGLGGDALDDIGRGHWGGV